VLLFAILWLAAALALGLTVAALTLIYQVLDTDLGTLSFPREAIIVLLTSAVQVGIFLGAEALAPSLGVKSAGNIAAPLAMAITWLAYRVTHLETMSDLEPAIVAMANIAGAIMVAVASWLLIGVNPLRT